MTSRGNRLSLTGGGRHVPEGYEWLVVAVFLVSVALVLYVATRGRR
ncbi:MULTISPECIES: hypothetical protein [Streptomyces]|nr:MULTISPECIES: hypothetical protein [Streptomyces]MDI5904085.1 hypothetical protein [Streptomyces sp. 12257]